MARQGLSRLLVAVAVLAAGAAWLGFTFQRTVFEPSRSERVVRVLLDSPDVRNVLVQRVVDAVDSSLPPDVRREVSLDQLANVANTTLDDPRVRAAIEQSLVGTQRYLIGDSEAPPSLDTSIIDAEIRRQLAVVRPDLATVVPTLPPLQLDLPAKGVEPVRKARDLVDTATPLLALVALAGATGALIVASNRPRVLRVLGAWALGAGALWVVLRFALPALAGAVLPSSAAIATALCEAIAGSMAGPGVALALVGAGLLVCGGLMASFERQAAHRDTRRLAQERAAARLQRKQASASQRAAAKSAKLARASTAAAAAPSSWPAADDPGTYRPPAAAPGVAPAGPGGVYVPQSRTAAAAQAAQPQVHPQAGAYGAANATMAMTVPGAPVGPPPVHSGAPAGHAPAPVAPHGSPGAYPAAGQVTPPAPPPPAPAAAPAGPRPLASSPVYGAAGGVAEEYATTISIPLPRRERGPEFDAEVAPPASVPGAAEYGAAAAAGPDGDADPGAGHGRPQPNEWLGGFSMQPEDHDRIADPAPPPPRWIEGVGYVYEYAPTPTARWIDGLGYVLADD